MMLTDELECDNAALQERARELEFELSESGYQLRIDNQKAHIEKQHEKEDELKNRIRELEAEVERTPGTRIKCLKQNALLSRSLEALKAAEWNKALSEHCYLIFVCQQCGNSKASGHAADCLIGNAIAEIEKFLEVSGE